MATKLADPTTGRFYVCDTNAGWIGVVFSERGLRATTTPQRSRDDALRRVAETGAVPASEAEARDAVALVTAVANAECVDGLAARIDWDSLGLTPFRRRVMEEALRIPSGETRTYAWLAAKVGRPRAARAVGRVMATNPLSVVVPCHRVVGADGTLRGYEAGLPVKAALLRAEGARVGGYAETGVTRK
ncbi:MAG: methylated-DNA--[protein]-cysteine S-methyltransferase [Dehalococcoidia bacterium]